MKETHQTARNMLSQTGLVMLANNKELLTNRSKNQIDFTPPKLQYYAYTISARQVTRRIEHEDLAKEGKCIISTKAENPWFKNQRVQYHIVPITNIPAEGNRIFQIPPRHFIEKNKATGQVRICGENAGPNGYDNWA